MAIVISEQEKQEIIAGKRSGKTNEELAIMFNKSASWIKRKLNSWLSSTERRDLKKKVFESEVYIRKQREAQKRAEQKRSTESILSRNERLREQSFSFSKKLRSGSFEWSESEIARRSAHGKKLGNSDKHQAAMREFAAARKKYHPEVIKKHFQKFGLEYAGDLSSSANTVTFFWPSGKTWRVQIKKAMLLDFIEEPSVSRPEAEILEWINSLGFSAKKRRIDGREIDIFLDELSLGIELNGMFWHSDICKEVNYHAEKTRFFRERGIRIIHIFESEWNIRKPQVQNFLLSALKKNKKIGARKLVWKEISVPDACSFLEQNHIQGANTLSFWAIGGFLGSELVTCSTFGHHHRTRKEIVLNRFACRSGLTVSGALSKISTMAFEHFQEPIVSWADKRFSEASGYYASGWKFVSETKPDYFYWSRKTGIVAKQSRMKSKMKTPGDMTEAEHARLDGLLRIWDCGKIKLSFSKN